MARNTQLSVQVVQQSNGWWFWRKLDGVNETVAVDRGNWNLETAIYAAHESNPEIDRVTVLLPDLEPHPSPEAKS